MAIMTIPRPLHIALDDLGWFCPTDDRAQGGPSRTGASRRHCYKDYLAVNELGKRLGMKISCAFVLGEWDPDNRLRSVKCLSKYGESWDNASFLDKEEMQRCVEAINASEYIDLTVHGLLHGYYTDGIDNTDESDFYYRINKEPYIIPEAEVRHRLDCYFDLLDHYKINKKVNSFIPPTFTYRWDELSRILADYGIEYVLTIFRTMKYEGDKKEIVDVEPNGIITIDRNNNIIPWNQMNCDYSAIDNGVSGVFGMHWPNLLHDDPDRNSEAVERAAEFFERCSQNFGTIISKGIKFCATQSLYCKYAKISEEDGVTTIDISGVPRLPQTDGLFYVSSKEPIETWIGCEVYDYEVKDGFATYAVKPISNVMRFDNV